MKILFGCDQWLCASFFVGRSSRLHRHSLPRARQCKWLHYRALVHRSCDRDSAVTRRKNMRTKDGKRGGVRAPMTTDRGRGVNSGTDLTSRCSDRYTRSRGAKYVFVLTIGEVTIKPMVNKYYNVLTYFAESLKFWLVRSETTFCRNWLSSCVKSKCLRIVRDFNMYLDIIMFPKQVKKKKSKNQNWSSTFEKKSWKMFHVDSKRFQVDEISTLVQMDRRPNENHHPKY